MHRTIARVALIRGVPLFGLIALGASAGDLPLDRWHEVLLLAVACAVAQLLPVQLFRSSSISVSSAVAFAGLVYLGPAASVWISLGSGLVMCFRPRRKTFEKMAFNVGNVALSAQAAGWLYLASGGVVGPIRAEIDALPAIAIAVAARFLLNTGLIAAAISATTGASLRSVWETNYRWLAAIYLGLGLVGYGMAVAAGAIGPLGLAISLVPLALAWYAYRLYVAEADQARRRNEELQLIRAMLAATPDLMLRLNRNGDVLGGNVDHAGVLPGTPGPAGRNVRDLLPANIVDPTLHYIGRTLDAGAMQIYEYQLATERGQGDFEARLVVSGENEVLAIVRDNTERKALERQLAHQAFHDALTGLPNRTLFMDRLQHAVARSSRTGATLAVLFLDLDRFKVVNDSLGHDVGDQLLIAVAAHLTRSVRASDTVARLGGDEFTILLEDVDAGIARRVAERIMATLQAPFVLAGHEVCVTTSIGIALNNEGPATADELMRDSDAAMYRGKSRGKARYEVFDASMHVRSLERLRLESELRHAIERGELSVHYQPTVSLVDGRVTGLEALVRWRHPERGLISPGVFVPVAEETGLILPLGRWVLAEACRQAKAWQIQHPSTPFTISVNLSVRQFQHPGLVDDVASVLQTVGLAPETLVLEITEGIVIETAEANSRVLEQLKGLGVRLAIDDFGTGYSNLSYLTRFPVDVLKIDRSFVDGLGHDRGDSAIVHTVISLARTLGLGVTAEGIETAEQLQLLRAAGCDSGQGFYFSRPVPDVEAERLIAAGRCAVDPTLALAG